MKQLLALTKRNLKEMMRDPLTVLFCAVFPLFMLILMSVIFLSLPYVPDNFRIENYAAGVCVFGYTFTALYIAINFTSDKNTSFIKRIYVSPVKKYVYIFSFVLSSLPVAIVQTLLFFAVSLCFGFPFDGYLFLGILYLLPSALFYICVGLLIGTLAKNEKQTGPISSVFISLTGILGGVFMPLEDFGGGFVAFVKILPFSHTVQIASGLHSAGASCIYPHILYILGYTVLIAGITVLADKLLARKRLS